MTPPHKIGTTLVCERHGCSFKYGDGCPICTGTMTDMDSTAGGEKPSVLNDLRFLSVQEKILKDGEAALERIAGDIKRIADALEAQPTLRDQMAMAALAGLACSDPTAPTIAYEVADAMLATRQKEGK